MATDPSEVSYTAVVKWFDRKKGFGFATPEGTEGSEDIFVHQRNIVADIKAPVLNEGDTITYKLGDHNGRQTAIEVRLPPGQEPTTEKRRRPRGRNAKKEMDAEAASDQVEEQKAADESMGNGETKENGDAKANGDAKPARPALGPDGKPWRKDARTRTRRNDKGAKPQGQREGQASARRTEKKAEVKQAAKETATES